VLCDLRGRWTIDLLALWLEANGNACFDFLGSSDGGKLDIHAPKNFVQGLG
jgi:hypothetical protein